MAGVFFSVGESLGHPRELVGDGNALVAQLLEALEIVGVLAHLLSLVSRNVAVELFAFMKALQIKIGTMCDGFIALFLGKNLLAESAAPEAINRLEFFDESFSLCGELFDGVWHGEVISI